MRRSAFILSCVALLSVPAPHPGAEPGPASLGPFLGLRLAGGLPWGDLTGDTFPVREQLVYATSATFEGGWRFHRRWDAGVAVELGHAAVAPTICPPGSTCWGWLGRATAQIRFHAPPGRAIDTWLALGTGLALADVRIVDTSQRWEGLEVLRLEGGVDFERGRYGLGVFLSGSADRFSREVVHARGYPVETASISNRAWSGWVMAGVRGTFRPAPRSQP